MLRRSHSTAVDPQAELLHQFGLIRRQNQPVPEIGRPTLHRGGSSASSGDSLHELVDVAANTESTCSSRGRCAGLPIGTAHHVRADWLPRDLACLPAIASSRLVLFFDLAASIAFNRFIVARGSGLTAASCELATRTVGSWIRRTADEVL